MRLCMWFIIIYIVVSNRKNEVATVQSSRSGIRLSEIYLHYNNICTDTLPSPSPAPLHHQTAFRFISYANSVAAFTAAFVISAVAKRPTNTSSTPPSIPVTHRVQPYRFAKPSLS